MHGNKAVSNKSFNKSLNTKLNIKSEVIKNCDTDPNLISKWKGVVSDAVEVKNIMQETTLKTCYMCTVKESFNVSLAIQTFEVKKLDMNSGLDMRPILGMGVGCLDQETGESNSDINHNNINYNIKINKIGDFFIPIGTVKMHTADHPLEFCIEVIEGLSVKLYLYYS